MAVALLVFKCGLIGAIMRMVLRAAVATTSESGFDFAFAEVATFVLCALAGFIWSLGT